FARGGEAVREIAAAQALPIDPPLLLLRHQLKIAASRRTRTFDDPRGHVCDPRINPGHQELQWTTRGPLLMPRNAVAFGQRNSGRRPPGPRGIAARRHARLGPTLPDPIDPRPLRLDFVTADEERRIAFDQIEQQSLVSDPPAILAEGMGKADI